MEVILTIRSRANRFRSVMLLALLLLAAPTYAQPPVKKYTLSNGSMQITLSKDLQSPELQDFINKYDVANLSLLRLISENFQDSVIKNGWKIEQNDDRLLVISKPLFSADNLGDPAERMRLTTRNLSSGNNPAPMNNQVIGVNAFKSNRAFSTVKDAVVFVLRSNKSARKVLLAGNFTNWFAGAIEMTQTDSGWSVPVKLSPGKYLYKFIVDGNWIVDPDNTGIEFDGEGNTNSVYYSANTTFKLDGFTNAKRVVLSGSFNDWQESKLRMSKTASGWELPVLLNNGTYTYRFIVDNRWMIDPANPTKFPNEFGETNSVISVGKSTLFILDGYTEGKSVYLTGSFNQWRNFELAMTKTATGWQVPYVLGPGNYEYKFYADGKWLNANGTIINQNMPGSIFVIEPNYTFRLKNMPNAKKVILAGDFNDWSPNAYVMEKDGNDWIFKVHLSTGKHLYKFVVDGNWIRDPGNTLWEQNEFSTGNSIVWKEE